MGIFTAMQLLLDRSGSMDSIRSDAEGGMKHFIDEQRKVAGKCTLRLSQFDDIYNVVHESLPLAEVSYPTLQPRGRTALLDAWGYAMTEFSEELDTKYSQNESPDSVIFVVVTDGYENASKEWTRDAIFAKVTELTKQGWTFLYLAAGQDAVLEGAKYGVPSGQSMTYANTSRGTSSTYNAMSASVLRTRSGKDAEFTEAERKAASQR